jgi:hypothetical protein
MAITFTYPIVTPKADDLIIGTQTPDPSSSETDTPTRNFTIQSIVDLAAAGGGTGISLLTVGTSGVSTLTAGVLNIPNYTADPSIVKTTGNQTIGGAKTFTTNIAAPNVGGDNTGDQSLSISGSVITISGTNSSVTVPSGGINTVSVSTAASTGAPLSAVILNSELTLTSGVFAGGNNAGYVPSGGTNTSFLRGDGTWSSTGTVTSVGLSTDIAAFAVGFANPITTQGTITLNLNGGTSGQFLRQDGTWATVVNGGAVDSVNGATGTVVLNTGDIAEVTNLYYTEARVSANTNVAANTAKVGITTAQATDITNSVKNDTDTYTSTPPVTKIITLTQAEYTAITTPNVNTLYIII